MNNKLKSIFWLSAIIYFTQGIEGLPSMSCFFYLKETLKFSASTIMYITALISIAWIIKPMWGFLSDKYLTKKKWVNLSLVTSIGLCLYLGFSSYLPLFLFALILIWHNANSAIRDVNIDGLMCISGKKNKCTGQIQAVQWISITIASIIVGIVGGYIAEKLNFRIGFLVLIPIYILVIFINKNYKEVSAKKEHTAFIPMLKKLFGNKQLLITSLFVLLYNFAPSFGTPLTFIERDTFGWSKWWISILGSLGSVCSIIGAIVYYKFSKKINIIKWLKISVILGAITSLCYLYFTPVSDVIYNVVFSVVGMFIHLIVMDFFARSVPKKLEATSFALLCSVSNLTKSLNSITGAWLLPIVGLPTLIIISSLTSFACLPIIKNLKLTKE